jgi:hypothetical protein
VKETGDEHSFASQHRSPDDGDPTVRAPLPRIGDVFVLAAPVVSWMLFRDRAWRGALELAVAMLAPVAAVVVLGAMTRSDYLLWLVTAMYTAMSVGMLLYLLVRWEVFDRVRRGPISGTAVASPSIPRSGSSK